ncbi:hypothetical protein G7085_02640 [Tessaracoccus sp. HDW20]|uniref:maleylpyruvate isomerase N-terminal domain-containing protein n=1 Tax=Tessaracoccus coleopterorum TaxID=2714950 RepID=UPI0018D2B1ED|nr:hypothetical protein [Tessaracoccus coleopterorum]
MSTNRAEFAEVVNAVRDHTSLLLGTTIGYSDDDWAEPTSLAGWTRSHVAAHLAEGPTACCGWCGARGRGAHPDVRVGSSQAEGDRDRRPDERARPPDPPRHERERTAERVRGPGGRHASRYPAARVSHPRLSDPAGKARRGGVAPHGSRKPVLDRRPGPRPRRRAPRLPCRPRRSSRRLPPLRLVADEGYEGSVGRSGVPTQLNGPAGDLVAWLARGTESSRIFRSTKSET